MLILSELAGYLCRGLQSDIFRSDQIAASGEPQPESGIADPVGKGGARERADDVFFARA